MLSTVKHPTNIVFLFMQIHSSTEVCVFLQYVTFCAQHILTVICDAYTVVDKVETILKSYNMKKKLSTCSILLISLLKLVADLLRVIFFEEHFGE